MSDIGTGLMWGLWITIAIVAIGAALLGGFVAYLVF